MVRLGALTRQQLRDRFAEFSRHGKRFDKAVDTVVAGGVKESLFLPSGRRIFTVVGNTGDEFVDPGKPYCSCNHFFFRVKGGKDELCYHILSYTIASKSEMVDVTEFSDEEYGPVLKAIMGDVLAVLAQS
jgi:predicted nucleic acid-binding Zn finger protein